MLSLTRSLILNGNVVTTLTKAKATRPYVERLITVSKQDSVANRRSTAAKTGNDAKVIAKLYKELGPKYKERKGGYTRIVKLGKIGAASMESARIELV